jgi:hypothetical protein
VERHSVGPDPADLPGEVMSQDGSMDDEHAPSHQVRHGERVPVAQGILSERHGISIADAVILLAAMTDARGVTPLRMATQIIDATVEPGSYPMPLGISFVDPSPQAPRPDP